MWRCRRSSRAVAAALATLALGACGRPAFVPYSPTADLVPPLADGAKVHLGGYEQPYIVSACDVDGLRHWVRPGPDASEWRMVIQEPNESSRTVSFQTRRFADQKQFDDAMTQIEDWFDEPCLSAGDASTPEVEPIAIDGLPSGAVSARWSVGEVNPHHPLSTVIADHDHRLMMLVVWDEYPDEVPIDDFVEVVNTAWADFEADNS